MTAPAKIGGRIVTFYSYKGGTGRSMALANVAWILASAGKRVLIIDWDLEAPGQHRYLHPFLEDMELQSTRGVIDFLSDFATAARLAKRSEQAPSSSADAPWYDACTSILSYACPVQWEFPGGGALDLMPAGRQDAAYPLLVTSFNWQEFYDLLGGGVFLEKVKQELREDYDYILIDSRTGLADTSGICTVQMPDSLVVCFTLNRQSIFGAAAVALSAESQRLKPGGEPGLRVWPVAMRIELAERERLESARDLCRERFQRFLGRLKRDDRAVYWGETEVLYQPYFAYEEVLAVFAERRGQTTSMLASMEALARRITEGEVSHLELAEKQRKEGLSRSLSSARRRVTPRDQHSVYVSYPSAERETAQRIVAALERVGYPSWSDRLLVGGDDWQLEVEQALATAQVLIVVIGSTREQRSPSGALAVGPPELGALQSSEVSMALAHGVRIVPVLAPGRTFYDLPTELSRYQAILFDDLRFDDSNAALVSAVEHSLARHSGVSQSIVPDDPQKGQWGGRAASNGRRITADVKSVSDDWFQITLKVEPVAPAQSLDGSVEFHLHPTFPQNVVTVDVKDGRAELRLSSWGAFTVGASADQGKTRLELDLSENMSFPETFRSR